MSADRLKSAVVEDLPYSQVQIGPPLIRLAMFLRKTPRKKDGKTHDRGIPTEAVLARGCGGDPPVQSGGNAEGASLARRKFDQDVRQFRAMPRALDQALDPGEASVLRVETTINHAAGFETCRTPDGQAARRR